ncbi:MAG: glycosyltransferase family 2 protein [Planctomycetota bacterium]
MTRPVSIVIPALGDTELLSQALVPLVAEVEARALSDEIIVVDDTGEDALAAWLEERFPTVRCVVREANGGFAKAFRSGVEAARSELVFSMNSDVVIRPGFLDPLVACLEDAQVFAVVPRVLLDGDEERVESLTHLKLERGMVEVVQPGLEGDRKSVLEAQPVAFAVGGTFLFRRDEVLGMDGFDALFEPFYWEDVDLSWRAWAQGRRVLYQPSAVVEHHHRGTIGKSGKSAWVRAAIERNRLLFQWKHLDGEALGEHLSALLRWIVDAYLADEREELLWLNLALDDAKRALDARAARGEPVAGFEELLAATRS